MGSGVCAQNRCSRAKAGVLNRSAELPMVLGTSVGVKLPSRSRGTSKSMSPTCEATVFGKLPLREFGKYAAPGSPRS